MELVPRIALVLPLLGTTASAQTQLNAPLPRLATGTVAPFAGTPDGSRFVYVADERADEVYELFVVPADGSAPPLVLAGPLVANGDVLNSQGALALSADGTTAVFLADIEQNDVVELWSVPLDGSAAPTKLSGALVPFGDVSSFRLTPDGATAVFLADAELDERHELFRVPTDASAARTRLHGALPANRDVLDYALGPLGLGVYFRADAFRDGVPELFSAPLVTRAPTVRLNDALASGRAVLDFRVTADESRVVYRADGVTDQVLELYSVPVDRSQAPVKLSPTPVSGGDVTRFELAPDGTQVAFLGDLLTNDLFELFRAPLDGSLPASALLPAASSVHALRFTPDSSAIVFGGRPGGGQSGLYRVPAAGGAALLLAAHVQGLDQVVELHFDASGSTVLYLQARTQYGPFGELVGSVYNLLRVPLDGSSPARALTERVPANSNFEWIEDLRLDADETHAVFIQFNASVLPTVYCVRVDGSEPARPLAFLTGRFELALDGERVVLTEGGSHPEHGRLWSFAIDGSEAFPLSPPTTSGTSFGDVSTFQPTPDGLQVVYTTSEEGGVYVAGAGGGTAVRALGLPDRFSLPIESSLVVAPTSERVAFLSGDQASFVTSLASAPLRPPGPAVVVTGPVQDGETLPHVPALLPRFTPDGRTLVFASGTAQFQGGTFALYRVPADGSAPPVRLNGSGSDAALWDAELSSLARERAFVVAPDGTRVVYAARATNGTIVELFSVPLDGSSAPVRLSRLTLSGTGVYGNWMLTPDGTRALYVVDQELRGRSELYSVPLDGSALPVRLNGALPTGGDVGILSEGTGLTGYVRVSPDGARVVYLADEGTDNLRELRVVPTDGSAAPLVLSGALPPDGDAQSYFQLDPAGTRVFFLADAFQDDVFELFTAPLDASAPPTKLSGPLVTGGDVHAAPKADGLVQFGQGRVVYTADALQDETVELFSVPVDASAPPVRLNAPLPGLGDVRSEGVLVTADGTTVLFRSDALANDQFELFQVPIVGGTPPVRLNLPLPDGTSDVESDVRVSARGNRLFYRADQDVTGEIELFTLRLEPRTPRGPALPPPISGTVTRGL